MPAVSARGSGPQGMLETGREVLTEVTVAEQTPARRFTRRRFLKTAASGVAIAAVRPSAAAPPSPAADPVSASISFGLVTDVHYADADARGSRHYRDSITKLRQAVDTFNRRKLRLVIELGDLIDAGPSKADELAYLRAIDKVYQKFQGDRHYVLGNHCLRALAKDEFLAACGARVRKSFYSFDHGRFHFVVLDGNFKRDGSPYAAGNFSWTDTWIHAPQQQWLAEDLQQAAGKKALVFVHQNLHDESNAHGVKNAPEVRRILETAGNVAAVFQGHMHSGGFTTINGIHYCTLKAMVEGPGPENNAYAVVTADESDRLTLEGYGRQEEIHLA